MGKEDTRRLKQIMTSAGEEAKRLGNSKIYPEHLFLGLLKLRSGRAIDILMSLGLDFYEVKDKIEQRLEGKRYKSDKVESLDFTLAANSVLKRVSDEAWGRPHPGWAGWHRPSPPSKCRADGSAAPLLAHAGAS